MRKPILLLLLLLLVLAFVFFARRDHFLERPRPSDPASHPTTAASPAPVTRTSGDSTTPTPHPPNPARPAMSAQPAAPGHPSNPAAAALLAPERSAADDLRFVQATLDDFRKRFGGFPTGDNREVVNALTGANPQRLAFLPRPHPAINADGELTDRWSTPLYFHHLASDIIEVRSAGPDRAMYTGDDLLDGSPAELRKRVRR
jgi:hypothetical protein